MTCKFFRRLIPLFLISALLLSLCACSDDGADEEDLPALTIWVFSDEYKSELLRAFSGDFISVSWRPEIVTVDASELSDKLAEAQESGVGLPDIFMLSPDNLRQYVDSDVTVGMDELGIELQESSHYGYTIDSAKNPDGVLKALCWQPDPGLFFYRRSMAQVYLGTDDPDEIQAMISDWEGFRDTAAKIHEASSGSTDMLVGVEGLMMPYLASNRWVEDGRLVVSDDALGFMDYAAALAESGVIYDAEQWSDAWVMGISDSSSVFGYFSSGLGMKNVLKKACGGTVKGDGSYGDWACAKGPAAYNWGGCWFAVRRGSDMLSEAQTFLRYFICEEEAMKKNCLISGFFSADRNVVDSIKFDTQFCDAFLSGQNYYNLMSSAAGDITAASGSQYDSVIEIAFADAVRSYCFGRKSKEQALEDFSRTVQAAYPELIIN